jgi:hypothetical protein
MAPCRFACLVRCGLRPSLHPSTQTHTYTHPSIHTNTHIHTPIHPHTHTHTHHSYHCTPPPPKKRGPGAELMALVTALAAGGRDVCYKCRGLLQARFHALRVGGCVVCLMNTNTDMCRCH